MPRGRTGIRLGIAAVAALVTLATPSTALSQTTVTANVFTDDPPGPCTPDHCTLREAVEPFETRTVQLLPGTYRLTRGEGLNINGAKTLNGAGAGSTTIDANNGSRAVIVVEGATVVINDVTITGGNAGAGQFPALEGGGIVVDVASSLRLNRSAVVGNHANQQGGGISITSNGVVEVTDSTISGNTAGFGEAGGIGAGLYTAPSSDVKLFNTTISSNRILPGRANSGGGLFAQGSLEMTHVTVAGNVTSGSAALITSSASLPEPLPIWNTIVAADGGPACEISNRTITGDHNLDNDGTCGFSRFGDKPGVNPLLGPLQNNGGATSTHALGAGSPAIDGGDAPHCLGIDQRGIARPQLRACDIGAFEFVPPPASPPPAPPPPEAKQLPPPVIRKSVNVLPKSGTVRIKRPGRRKKFVKLTEGRQIPVGSIIDTRKGRVTLTAAADNRGNTATADFYEGLFKVGQTKGAKPFTTAKLTEKLSCPRAGKATTAAKRKRKRRLWGDGSGRFRTEGQYSSATVRGTIWLTQDHCDRTWTKVTRGKVAVRDFIRKKTIIVRAGKQYIARVRR